jgi:dTDP-4-dehydrorhamnose 3,5-epimerase
MRFAPTGIAGSLIVHLDRHSDERGSFTRLFDAESFAAHGLPGVFVQTSLSATTRAGTVRGLHFQRPPFAEVKLVRCLRGALFDVVVDLRAQSPTRGQWRATTLREDDDMLVAIPAGCAHGFQTLADGTELLYQISVPHAPDHADGVRFDDPAFGIAWPRPVTVVSARDRAWKLLANLPQS